jgi:hypothetical protein
MVNMKSYEGYLEYEGRKHRVKVRWSEADHCYIGQLTGWNLSFHGMSIDDTLIQGQQLLELVAS